MTLSLSEIEKGAAVCEYWELNSGGVPVKPKAVPRIGLIVKVVYDDGTKEGTEHASGAAVREIWAKFEEDGKPEKIRNQSLVLHRRADQATQFQLRKIENNGLVQDGRSRPKMDGMNLHKAANVNPNSVEG